jgi:hypothetical protein
MEKTGTGCVCCSKVLISFITRIEVVVLTIFLWRKREAKIDQFSIRRFFKKKTQSTVKSQK